MPVIEAMAVGCPVVTCRNSSLTEVAGDAALYVDEDDPSDLAIKLVEIQRPEIRDPLVRRGFERSRRFNWKAAADRLEATLRDTITRLRHDHSYRPPSAWQVVREVQHTWQMEAEITLARVKALEEKRAGGISGADVLPINLGIPGYNYVAELKRELREAREMVDAMKRSPFWKLRLSVLALLRSFGFRRRHA